MNDYLMFLQYKHFVELVRNNDFLEERFESMGIKFIEMEEKFLNLEERFDRELKLDQKSDIVSERLLYLFQYLK